VLPELQMPLKNACRLMATPRLAEVLVFGALECVGGHCRSFDPFARATSLVPECNENAPFLAAKSNRVGVFIKSRPERGAALHGNCRTSGSTARGFQLVAAAGTLRRGASSSFRIHTVM